ncbi:hypothetical protein RSK20926_06542 [Roseobacter sp. SK209-2-6]|nr:hypothetical protein RSK20926_06542 [Roseobacter sp. SK209-2-6]
MGIGQPRSLGKTLADADAEF